MPDYPGFPENLRRARKARRLSVHALGAQVGITGQAISKYETGKSYPSSSTLVHLARALGVGVECLMCTEVCIAAPPPRQKPPTSRLGRARRWAALWKVKARAWRVAARIATEQVRREARARRALVARVAELERWIDQEAMPRYTELLSAAGIDPATSVLVEQARAMLGEEPHNG
jgi:transcriptional regulator with XRE-family HTH domain